VSHFIIRLRFVFTPSLGLDYISNANPACSCVYICKFQFRPIHPPLGDYQFRPDPPRDSKTQSETVVPRTARARATTAPRTARPIALTPRRDRWRLWQEKRATLRLRHNDRVKKGTSRHSISYPFPSPLSLSYNRDRERGIPRKGSFSMKETGSEPPY
jgi:hypothetical protein